MKKGNFLRRHYGKLLIVLMLAGAVAYLVYLNDGRLGREDFMELGKSLPPVIFIALFFILPLLGFPISLLLLLVGIRFGSGWGMVITAAGMTIHHFLAYRITHGLFREKMRRKMASIGYAIPSIQGDHRIWFTALFATIHGPPYAAKLYLLALTDLPFRYYFWVGLPLYVAFAAVPVCAGDALMELNTLWLSLIVAFGILLLILGHWLTKKYAFSGQSESGVES